MLKDCNARGLFVMHEGMSSAIFKSQVLEHAISLRGKKILFDILSFEVFSKSWKASVLSKNLIEQDNLGIKLSLKKGCNIYYPFSAIINALLLFFVLRKKVFNYDFIHARSDYTAFLCLLLKPFHGLPVVWDCRGESFDELCAAIEKKATLFRLSIGLVLKIRQKLIISVVRRFSSGSIFVSEELRKVHLTKGLSKYVVIPCPVPENKFFFDERIRKKSRKSYGIGDSECVFLYSGSMVNYQSLKEQRELYEKLLSSRPNNIIIFATNDKGKAAEYFNGLSVSRFLIMSFKYYEMNSIYNMADFAIMLREPRALNWVASPTKFGEYCLSGLPVIMNDTIDQAIESSTKIGNHYHVSEVSKVKKFSNNDRKKISTEAFFIYSRKEMNRSYVDFYTQLLKR